MNVFISHTLAQQEEHLLTVLAFSLRNEGFGISNTTEPASVQKGKHILSPEAHASILSSDLLVGIVTQNGHPVTSLYKEWDLAIQKGIPLGLLVETGVVVDDKYRAYAIYFNRTNLSVANGILEEKKKYYYLSEYEPRANRTLNRAQRITWSAVYDVLLTILPVFESKVSV